MTTVDPAPNPTPGYVSPLTYDEATSLFHQVPHVHNPVRYPRPGTPPGLKRAALIAFNRIQFHYTPGHPLHEAHANIDGPAAELRLIALIAESERTMRFPRKKALT